MTGGWGPRAPQAPPLDGLIALYQHRWLRHIAAG